MADSLRISTATRDQTSQDEETARDNATLKAGMPDYGMFEKYGKFGRFGKFGEYGQWGKYGTWGKYGKFGKLGAEGKFGESGGEAEEQEEEEELGWWNSMSCESECPEGADPWSEECYDWQCYDEKCSEKCYFDDGPPWHPCEVFYPPPPWMEEELGPIEEPIEYQDMKDVLDSDCYKCALCHDDDCWSADLECEVECYDECWADGATPWDLHEVTLKFRARRNSTQGPDAAAPSGKPLSAYEKAMAAHPKTGRLEFHQLRRMKAQKRKKEGKFGCGECFHACHEKKGDPCAWFGELEAPDLPPYYYDYVLEEFKIM